VSSVKYYLHDLVDKVIEVSGEPLYLDLKIQEFICKYSKLNDDLEKESEYLLNLWRGPVGIDWVLGRVYEIDLDKIYPYTKKD
jgi:hypothetical protein